MKNNIFSRTLILGAIFVVSLFVGAFIFTNKALANDYCNTPNATMSYEEVGAAQAAGQVSYSIAITGSTAQANITNNTSCSFPVELTAWEMYDRTLENQVRYSSSGSQTVTPRSNKTITTTLPSCMAQVDLYYGFAPTYPQDSYELTWAYSRMSGGSSYSDASGQFCTNQTEVPLTGSCYATPSNPQVGEEMKWSADAAGGAGGHTYTWTGTDGLNSTGFHYAFKTYGTSGTKNATVVISDIAYGGTQTITANCSVNVSPEPVISNPAYATCGSAANQPTATAPTNYFCGLGSLVEGPAVTGDGTNRWWWGCNLTPSAPAVTYCFAPKTNVSTQNPLGGSCQVIPANGSAVNQSVNWRASAWDGTGSYTYVWSSNDGLSGTEYSVFKTYPTSGTKSATVVISSGSESVTRTCTTNITPVVNNNLSVSCDADESTVDVDENVHWLATVSGGNGSYYYNWSGSESLHGSGQSVTWSYDNDGTKSATVTVTSNGQVASDSCTVRVDEENTNDNLRVSCYASPSSAQVGSSVTWRVNVSGGDGDYDYDWNGTNGLNSSSRNPSMVYNSAGNKSATVTVEDGDGNSDSDTCSATINQNTVLAFSEYNQTPYQEAIYLNQVPYTGVAENWSLALFVSGLALLSAYIAYAVIAYKKRNGELN